MNFKDLITNYRNWPHYVFRIWQDMDSKMISTIVLIFAMLIARSVIVAWLEKSTDIAPHIVIRWRQRLYQLTLLAIVILVAVIWAPELRTFAVTLVVIAAALVAAFKELISCFMGTFIRANVEGAHTGGRIMIDNVHGDVAATDLMSTTILEVNDYGQRTGRTIVLPNSFFISHATTTESADDRKYVLMVVSIPALPDENWLPIEQTLLEMGQAIVEPYLKEAKKHFARFNRRYGFDAPGPEPKVLIDWKDPQKITLNLRLAVPVTEQNAKRQEILRGVLTKRHENRENDKKLPSEI
jgi:small-conductance mechanosensitive channel